MTQNKTNEKLTAMLEAAKGKLPPMMGWSTWNQFHQNISEKLVMEQAHAIKELGLLSAGYGYINLDDCWQASQREVDGCLSFDVGRFPSKEGIVGKLNNLGFKVGIYSSCGELTCEDMPGSYGYEEIDARTWASWGIEYLKYDYCHVVDMETDPHFEEESFTMGTPPILYLAITSIDGGEERMNLASQFTLTPPAAVKENAIVGLDCPRAAGSFTIDVPLEGCYQVAIGYVKTRSIHRRFALLGINDDQINEIWFPRTSGWSDTGRVTTKVNLRKGRNKFLLTNPIRGQKEDSILRYTRMGQALKRASSLAKPIFFSICEHGRTKPWTWASDFAGSWRTSGDISPSWQGVMKCYEATADLWQYQKPGAYNDPDMLEVNVGEMTEDESITHFILWCMLSAPLILGLNLKEMARDKKDKVLDLISNQQLIAINQDALLLQASRKKLREQLDILLKPLADGSCALCVLNQSQEDTESFSLTFSEIMSLDYRLCLEEREPIQGKNVMEKSDWMVMEGEVKIPEIKPHQVFLMILKNVPMPLLGNGEDL